EEEEEPEWLDDDKGDEEEAAKHKGEEGKAGKEDSEQEDKEMEVEGDEADDPEVKKERDTKIAENAGVADVIKSDEVSSMWGSSEESVGADAQHALGNLDGAEGGEAKGFGGLGLASEGRGGGGDTEDGLGIGDVDTAGKGGGGEGGDGYGRGEGDLGEKEDAMPQVVPQKPAVEGSLDKEIIRRVVRQHRREIAACYERELQKDKSLSGRVKVKFVISANGSVMSASVSESSLDNSTVEQCITGKIRQWGFPDPEGNGIVEVNYPFNFSRQ
ncbi:MAG: TonB family protein, partial [Persicimonas sp.]